MSQAPSTKTAFQSRLLTGLLIAFFFAAIVQSALILPTLGAGGNLVDFDAFFIVGQLAQEGRVEQAYDLVIMSEIQRALVGHEGFMPWTYPPHFDILTLALPLLPRWLAYAAFTGGTMAFYLWVLVRLAGPRLLIVLIAFAPPIYVTATIGQNAFLIGGLMGSFALLARRDSPKSGLPLGLLVIKPHLGIGLGVYVLFARQWRALAVALLIAVLWTALATLVFGPSIWAAFLDGVDAAGRALEVGFYPLFRMTSTYAALHTIGADPKIALAGQITVAALACGAIAYACIKGIPRHQAVAMAIFGSALVSPYLYDYDMTVVAAGVALLIHDVERRTTRLEQFLLLLLTWVAGGWGMIHALSSATLSWEERAAIARETISYGAFAYLLLLILLWRILQRPQRSLPLDMR